MRYFEARTFFFLATNSLISFGLIAACGGSKSDSSDLSSSASSSTEGNGIETSSEESSGNPSASAGSGADNMDGDKEEIPSEKENDSAGSSDAGQNEGAGSGPVSDEGSEADEDDEGDGPRFDVSSEVDFDVMLPKGGDDGTCRGVDILFVIDGSGSMDVERQRLASSVGGFANALVERLEIIDGYHIGITTPGGGERDIMPPPWSSPMYPRLVSQETCDLRGSLTDTCEYVKGRSFLTQHDADDGFTDKLNCAILEKTNWDGDERPMEAMIKATAPANSEAEACNQYFMRDDAVLVIVNITDEEDDSESFSGTDFIGGSPGDPQTWFEQMVENKGGDESNIVVLTISGRPESFCGAEDAPRLIGFTERFTYGFSRDICARDYAPFFEEALDSIESACEDFGPVE